MFDKLANILKTISSPNAIAKFSLCNVFPEAGMPIEALITNILFVKLESVV